MTRNRLIYYSAVEKRRISFQKANGNLDARVYVFFRFQILKTRRGANWFAMILCIYEKNLMGL